MFFFWEKSVQGSTSVYRDRKKIQKITLVYIGLGQTWKRKQISTHDLKSLEKKKHFCIFQIILHIDANTHESYNLV